MPGFIGDYASAVRTRSAFLADPSSFTGKEEGRGMTEQQALFGVDTRTRARGDAKDVERRRARRAAARDVKIPEIVDPARRDRCEFSLLHFLMIYLAPLFPKPFSWDHYRMIHRLQKCILRGELYVIAAPRGTGKSTIVIGACIWALLFGHRAFLVILCGNHTNSRERLDAIRTSIETNELLYDDFPGPCACVRALSGAWNRGPAQTVNGERTHIRWGGTQMLVFPTLKGVRSSGACIATRSMKTAIKGINHFGADGQMRRPDTVLLDDPIEKEQAESPTIVEKRETKIDRDALQLGGPGVAIAGVMVITVVEPDDLASRYLDKARHPNWRRARFQLMYDMPANEELWATYADLRIESHEKFKDSRLCDEFYRINRVELDMGARAAWAARFSEAKGETSAIQHAMNILIDFGEEVFYAEYQNDPRKVKDDVSLVLDAYRVERSGSGIERGIVPNDAIALVCGADVNKFGIHWAVLSAAPGRILNVVDYGVQGIDAPVGRIDAEDTVKRQALELAIRGGLRRLREKLTDPEHPFLRANGEPVALTLGLPDSRWMGHVVDQFCAETGNLFFAAMGCGTQRNQPKFKPPKGAQLSLDGNVYVKFEPILDERGKETGRRRRFMAHSDAYKQQLHAGFFLDPDEPGSIRVFTPTHRKDHHSYARHLTAELQIEKAPGVFVWESVRGRADNHYLDATYLGLCAISILEHRLPALAITGIRTEEAREKKTRKRSGVQIEHVAI